MFSAKGKQIVKDELLFNDHFTGVTSASLAIASAVGLLSVCGIPFNEVVASMPFLVIGKFAFDAFDVYVEISA